jgi:hypothetical protein
MLALTKFLYWSVEGRNHSVKREPLGLCTSRLRPYTCKALSVIEHDRILADLHIVSLVTTAKVNAYNAPAAMRSGLAY